jgi:hypothetical protein
VGGDAPPQDYVSFPKGSEAARGAGGTWSQGPEVDSEGRGTPLPPEVVAAPKPPGDDGLALWIPVLGLALAGAGVGLGVAHRR